MRGIGYIDPITKQWQDSPPDMMTSDNKIRQAGHDKELNQDVLIDQQNWDRIRDAVLSGRRELQRDTATRVLILKNIANALKWGASFQQGKP